MTDCVLQNLRANLTANRDRLMLLGPKDWRERNKCEAEIKRLEKLIKEREGNA